MTQEQIDDFFVDPPAPVKATPPTDDEQDIDFE
jgi:hypothetical protein